MTVLFALTSFVASTAIGQGVELPKPGPEFDVFQNDVGTWDVEIKTWAGPGEPTLTKGKETNRMLGGFWLLSDFQGNMMGLDFQGHGVHTYDAEKQQYSGIWIDTLSAKKMNLIGKYNPSTKTMTYEGTAPRADGQPAKHVMTTKYREDGTREMSMHMQDGDEMIKIFEMSYTKSKP